MSIESERLAGQIRTYVKQALPTSDDVALLLRQLEMTASQIERVEDISSDEALRVQGFIDSLSPTLGTLSDASATLVSVNFDIKMALGM